MSQKAVKHANVANALTIKPILAGGVAAAGEKFINKADNMTALYFGASVGAGIAVSGTVGAVAAEFLPTSTNIGSKLMKNLEARVIEIGCGAGSSWAINKYVLKNEWQYGSQALIRKMAIITAADFIAEAFSETLSHTLHI